MSEAFWNERLDFLKAIRTGWCNEDYIEFLIEKVWNITKPVNLIDFGCGFGYVGLLFLPLLPKGSTYTGVDISEKLLKEAENIFEGSGYTVKFIKADLNEYESEEKYDIAISQAVLRHIPNAEKVIGKMIQAIVPEGLVICMESDLEIEKAGCYFSGLDYIELGMTELHRKLYRTELKNGGRDYRFAMKIPMLMQEMGLYKVGVRMNDSIKFINPIEDEEKHLKQFNALTEAWGWNKQLSEVDKTDYISGLIDRGLSREEAESYVEGISKISEYLMNNKDSAYVIQAPGTLISYGTKKSEL